MELKNAHVSYVIIMYPLEWARGWGAGPHAPDSPSD